MIHLGGLNAIFFYTATMHASFVAFVLYRMLVRAPVPAADRGGLHGAEEGRGLSHALTD